MKSHPSLEKEKMIMSMTKAYRIISGSVSEGFLGSFTDWEVTFMPKVVTGTEVHLKLYKTEDDRNIRVWRTVLWDANNYVLWVGEYGSKKVQEQHANKIAEFIKSSL